ncbi:sericin 1-like [Penaeus indicus]|uniref:sericin 1-like n=1 Tax=Penaeus indicus TaxID=29960 RepID=UPI00300D478F
MVLQAAQLRRNEAAKHTPPQKWTTMVAMYNNDMEGAHGRPSDEDIPERDVPPSVYVAEDEGPAKSGGHGRGDSGHGAAMARAEEGADHPRNPTDEDSTSYSGATGSSEGLGHRGGEDDAAGFVEGAAATGASERTAANSEAEPPPGHNSDDSASDDTIRGAEDGAAKGNDGDENKENVDNTLKESDEESDTEGSEDEDAARDDEGVEWLLKIDDLELYKKAMVPEHFYLRISSPKVLTEDQLRLALDRLLGELKWLRLGLKHRQGDCWICYLPKATMQVRICNDDSLGYIMEEPQRSHYYLHNDLLCTVHILADPQVPRTRGRRRGKKANNNSADKGDSANMHNRNPICDYKYLLLLAGPPPLLNEASGRLISDTFVKHLNDAIEESVAQEPAGQSPGSSTGSGTDANLDSPSVAQNPSGLDTLNNAGGSTASGISSDNGSSEVSAASGISSEKGSSEVSVITPFVDESPNGGVSNNGSSEVSAASGNSSDKGSSEVSVSTSGVPTASGNSSDKGSSEVSVSTSGVPTASGISSDKGSSEVSVNTLGIPTVSGTTSDKGSSEVSVSTSGVPTASGNSSDKGSSEVSVSTSGVPTASGNSSDKGSSEVSVSTSGVPTASGNSSDKGSSEVSVSTSGVPTASGNSSDKGSSEVSVSTSGVPTASGISSDKGSSEVSLSTSGVPTASGISSVKGSSEVSVNTLGIPTVSGTTSDKGSSEVSVSTSFGTESPKEGVSNTEVPSATGESSADADSVFKQDENNPSDTEVCSGTESVNVSLDIGSATGACSNNGDKSEISLNEIQHIKTFLSEFKKDVSNNDLRFGGENGEENEDDDTYGGVRKSLDSCVSKNFLNRCKAGRVSYFNAFVACVNAAAIKLLVEAGLEPDREVVLFHKVNVRFPWPRQEWWTDRDDDGNEADGDDEDDDDEYSSGQERSAIKVSTVPSSWQNYFWKTAQTVNSNQWEAAEIEKPEVPRKIRPPNEEEVGEQDEGPCAADIHLSVPNITEIFEFSAQRQLFKVTTIRKLTFVHQFLMTFNINLYIDAESGNLGFYLNHSTVFNSRAVKIRFAKLILAVLKRSLQL